MFGSTPKSRWYGDEHASNRRKSQNKFKTTNKLKKHAVENHTNIKNTFEKINHELHEQKHLLCNWWFQTMAANKKHVTHWVIHEVLFGDAKYCGHDFHASCQNNRNLYIKKSYVYIYDLHQHQKNIAVWFVIPKKLLCQIFAWYLHQMHQNHQLKARKISSHVYKQFLVNEKYEKNDVKFTIHFFGDIKHFETWQRFSYVETYKL